MKHDTEEVTCIFFFSLFLFSFPFFGIFTFAFSLLSLLFQSDLESSKIKQGIERSLVSVLFTFFVLIFQLFSLPLLALALKSGHVFLWFPFLHLLYTTVKVGVGCLAWAFSILGSPTLPHQLCSSDNDDTNKYSKMRQLMVTRMLTQCSLSHLNLELASASLVLGTQSFWNSR